MQKPDSQLVNFFYLTAVKTPKKERGFSAPRTALDGSNRTVAIAILMPGSPQTLTLHLMPTLDSQKLSCDLGPTMALGLKEILCR